MVKVPAAQPAPRVPRSRRDDRYDTGRPAPPKRATAGYVVSIQDTYDTVTVDVLDEELTGVIPLGDMPPVGAIVEVEARGDLLVIPVWFEGPPPPAYEWVPFQITTDTPSSIGQAQTPTRAYFDHWELRQQRSGTTVTLQLFDLAVEPTGPVTRTLVYTDTYPLATSSVVPVSLEALGGNRFFVLLNVDATHHAARVIDVTGGTISIGAEQTFTAAPVSVTGYEVLAVDADTVVATAGAYWWEFTISGATVTRGTPAGRSGQHPIIAMPDGKVVADSHPSGTGDQKLTVHSVDGAQLGAVTLGTYDQVRVSALIGTQNGHGGVDSAGRAVATVWSVLDGDTRGSMVVRAYGVSSTLTEVAHLDVVPEEIDPDTMEVFLDHFAGLGTTGSEFLLVGWKYAWTNDEARHSFVRVIDTQALTQTDIPRPPEEGGGVDNKPYLYMAINENAFLLTYAVPVYHEYFYVRREL